MRSLPLLHTRQLKRPRHALAQEITANTCSSQTINSKIYWMELVHLKNSRIIQASSRIYMYKCKIATSIYDNKYYRYYIVYGSVI